MNAATRTEDRYFCRDCRHVGHADEVGDTITCEMCDSPNLVHELVMRDEIRRDVEAQMARDERIAEYRARRRPYVPLTRSMSGYGHFDDRVQAMGSPVREGALLRAQAA